MNDWKKTQDFKEHLIELFDDEMVVLSDIENKFNSVDEKGKNTVDPEMIAKWPKVANFYNTWLRHPRYHQSDEFEEDDEEFFYNWFYDALINNLELCNELVSFLETNYDWWNNLGQVYHQFDMD